MNTEHCCHRLTAVVELDTETYLRTVEVKLLPFLIISLIHMLPYHRCVHLVSFFLLYGEIVVDLGRLDKKSCCFMLCCCLQVSVLAANGQHPWVSPSIHIHSTLWCHRSSPTSMIFPPPGIFTFLFPGPFLLSKTTVSLCSISSCWAPFWNHNPLILPTLIVNVKKHNMWSAF